MTEEVKPYNAHNTVEWLHYLTHDEVDVLQDLARLLPPNPIVAQIGAGGGTSGLAFMQARDDLTLFSIDIQLESSPFGCLEGERLELEKAGFVGTPRYQPIHGDSKEVGKRWKETYNLPVDMCFIDGDHSYLGAKGDITIWLPLLKPHSIMAIHDFEKKVKIWYGVDRAVRECFGNQLPLARVDTLIAYEVNT